LNPSPQSSNNYNYISTLQGLISAHLILTTRSEDISHKEASQIVIQSLLCIIKNIYEQI
ncbi:17145_t:CDS:1, partial [Dentiscutata erythropus]